MLACASSGEDRVSSDGEPSLDAAGRLDWEAPFWEAFEIDADWAEYFPTLLEMAEGSDVTALGTIVGISPSSPVSSAPEDLVAEAIIDVEIVETIRGEERTTLAMSLVYNKTAQDAEELRAAIDDLSSHFPAEPVLLLLRRRSDREDQYRVVNGYGLWARTLRRPLDAPLDPGPPTDGLFADEISTFNSVDDLADALRP